MAKNNRVNTRSNPEVTLEIISKRLDEVLSSQDYLSKQFDDFYNKQNRLEEENKILKKEMLTLNLRITTMERDLSDIQQHMNKSNMTISGIPDIVNENINNIVENILKIINTEICVNDIVSTHIEKPISKNNKSNKINIKFNSSETKEKFLNCQKVHGPIMVNQLKLNNNDSSNITSRIYFNEFLSTTNKKILYEAQQLKKKHNIKFAWAKHGAVFMRYDEVSKIFRIRDLQQLSEIDRQMSLPTDVETSSRSPSATP